MENKIETQFKVKTDRFLHPGELCITEEPMIIKTILGSCVSVVFFHGPSKLSGVCHAMLPTDTSKEQVCENCTIECTRKTSGRTFRFVTCAIIHMYETFSSKGIPAQEIEVKLFGGASVLKNFTNNIGKQNSDIAKEVLQNLKLTLSKEDIGGNRGRTISFDSNTGDVIVKKYN